MTIAFKKIMLALTVVIAAIWGGFMQDSNPRQLRAQERVPSNTKSGTKKTIPVDDLVEFDIENFEPIQLVMPSEEEKSIQLLNEFLNEEPEMEFAEFEPAADDLLGENNLTWPYAPLTSMTQVAQLYPPHVGPTKLFLNFDGSDDYYVSSFVSTTGDRERDIQHIMFAASQTFAPFNVQVLRFHGNGQKATSNGHTTIFIGDKLGNSIFFESDSGAFIDNNKRAYADGDYPCPGRGFQHVPNSDPYNLGFVDPISWTSANGYVFDWSTNDNDAIARAICHEAGHTFGLAHVLSGSNPDVMSYSYINKKAMNIEYPLTSLNSQVNGPTVESWNLKPMWWFYQFDGFGGKTQLAQAPLDTQNSFQCLLATLGPRNTSSDYANIANNTLVSGAYVDAASESIGKYQLLPSQINNFGDYDVFDLAPETTEVLEVKVNAMEGDNWFDPIVLIYDSNGNLVEYDDDSGSGKAAKGVFQAVLGDNYKVVVGAKSNNTHGTYQLTVEPAEFELNPALGGGSIGGLTKNGSGTGGGEIQQFSGN